MGSIVERERELSESFLFFPDAMERMAYLMDGYGGKSNLGEGEAVEGNLVSGCLSQLWLCGSEQDGVWEFRAASDAPIVQALAAVVVELYSGATREEICGYELQFFESTGLIRHLTPNRQNGVRRMVERVRELVGG